MVYNKEDIPSQFKTISSELISVEVLDMAGEKEYICRIKRSSGKIHPIVVSDTDEASAIERLKHLASNAG